MNGNGYRDDRPEPEPQAATGAAEHGAEPGRRIALDPETVGRDLASLVLTVVELVRQLMERQALRRIDQGDLSDDQVERIGLTLMALEDRMADLQERFGLTADDLNIDLGPLGPLLARD
ncbi:gas vesicle protein K [Streptomyces tateyamensis]|uniref:Gas vesicle protein K n=1 Tax=Streptomyces tateyamensis TaxID=565073 RepID=A0A2V4NM80_9ACTN|nr:gas vesicle protein K [Streptomyces tateyamensis]